ncbi:hypothetical protein L1049_026132 [Liquidambar formosana]|uniref:BZIP domain-containing protein n=1 Tax=Liquidambar formosana TaxID=63359 RepID=A0AAP0NE56_LIQFO
MFFPQDTVECQFPVCEAGFTASEIQELLSLFQTGNPASSNSGSDTNPSVCGVDERKRRRMLSNRESARRSRWRKKRHLENLNDQLNRMKLENREYKNRLGLAMHQFQLVQRENDRLRFESAALRARLSDLYQILLTLQLQ